MEMAYDNNVFQALPGSVRVHNVTGVQVNMGSFCNFPCEHCHLKHHPDVDRLEDLAVWGGVKDIS